MSASGDLHPGSASPQAFDPRSGGWAERLFFNHRLVVLLICLMATLLLGHQARHLDLQASFERMIPTGHPYVANYLAQKKNLKGQGNAIRIAVATEGSIFDPAYLEALRKINDEVFLIPGVDRPFMKSLWTPTMRWIAVTEDGLDGGPVMVDSFDGSPDSIEQLRQNIERSGEIGQLIAPNFKSTIILVPLLDVDPHTGQAIDYGKFSAALEKIRSQYERGGLSLHITGFGKIVGDLIAGLQVVLFFFAGAILICTAVLYTYTRCARSTFLVVVCSLIAVVWLCGILGALGRPLDPYSILVPFLVFAIGMSHGAQKMNGVMQDIGRGVHKLVAARMTFRRLFLAGLTALMADAVGFAVLMIIGIRVIQDLAVAASIGVAILILTNLVLLPILLSYTGVSPVAARRSLANEPSDDRALEHKHVVWALLDKFCTPKWAGIAIGVSALLGIAGLGVSAKLKIGDLDPGAPELRADSRYNRDNAFITNHYGASSDTLVVMVTTPAEMCARYDTLIKVDALEWALQQLPGVASTHSFAALTRRSMAGLSEGNLKWAEILRNQDSINAITTRAPRELFNQACDMLAVYVYLKDHKADTLTGVVNAVEAFSADNDTKDVKFLLGAGNAGIEAATNIVVKDANRLMLVLVYAAVVVLAFITFRSWRAVVCAVVPLVLTSILCEALMVVLGIGVKVATLPVIALGVGIGVDYALYVLSITLGGLRAGATLSQAYYRALLFTGKVVLLTGGTLAIAVAVWAFSPIKFQADMGLLLAFMFIWNMLGALILLPALASFLLTARPASAPATDAAAPLIGRATS